MEPFLPAAPTNRSISLSSFFSSPSPFFKTAIILLIVAKIFNLRSVTRATSYHQTYCVCHSSSWWFPTCSNCKTLTDYWCEKTGFNFGLGTYVAVKIHRFFRDRPQGKIELGWFLMVRYFIKWANLWSYMSTIIRELLVAKDQICDLDLWYLFWVISPISETVYKWRHRKLEVGQFPIPRVRIMIFLPIWDLDQSEDPNPHLKRLKLEILEIFNF